MRPARNSQGWNKRPRVSAQTCQKFAVVSSKSVRQGCCPRGAQQVIRTLVQRGTFDGQPGRATGGGRQQTSRWTAGMEPGLLPAFGRRWSLKSRQWMQAGVVTSRAVATCLGARRAGQQTAVAKVLRALRSGGKAEARGV